MGRSSKRIPTRCNLKILFYIFLLGLAGSVLYGFYSDSIVFTGGFFSDEGDGLQRHVAVLYPGKEREQALYVALASTCASNTAGERMVMHIAAPPSDTNELKLFMQDKWSTELFASCTLSTVSLPQWDIVGDRPLRSAVLVELVELPAALAKKGVDEDVLVLPLGSILLGAGAVRRLMTKCDEATGGAVCEVGRLVSSNSSAAYVVDVQQHVVGNLGPQLRKLTKQVQGDARQAMLAHLRSTSDLYAGRSLLEPLPKSTGVCAAEVVSFEDATKKPWEVVTETGDCDTSCEAWARCEWQTHIWGAPDTQDDLLNVVASSQSDTTSLTEEVLHAASVYPDGSTGHKMLYPAMASICKSGVADGLRVVFHLLELDRASKSLEAFEREWTEAHLPCKLVKFVEKQGNTRWKEVVKEVAGAKFAPPWPDYWRSIMLPAALGRRGLGLVLIFSSDVLALSSGIFAPAMAACEAWMRQHHGIACLPQRGSREGLFIANTTAYAARKVDKELFKVAKGLDPGFTIPSLYRSLETKVARSSTVGPTCRVPGLFARDPYRPDLRTSEILPCHEGIVHFASSHWPWRRSKPSNIGTCLRHGECDAYAACVWWRYKERLPNHLHNTSEQFFGTQASMAAATAWNDPFLEAEVKGPKCNLRWFQDKAHLFTMVPSTDYDLMEHFMKHYSTLGIDMERRFRVIVHNRSDDTVAEMLNIIGRYSSVEPVVVNNYTSDIKLKHVNTYMSKLPKDAWLVYPDTDEFFEFPCSLKKLIEQGSTEFYGEMMERLGLGLTLPLLRPSTNILEQYPLQCPYRRKLMRGGWASKYMLLKVWTSPDAKRSRRFTSSHTLSNTTVLKKGWGAGRFLGPFAHLYFVGAGACDKLAFKQSIYQSGIRGMIYQKGGEVIDCSDGTPKLVQDVRERLHELCEVQEEC